MGGKGKIGIEKGLDRVTNNYNPACRTPSPPGKVGIVSTSDAGVREIACVLNAEDIATSQIHCVEEETGRRDMLAGLQALQNDPSTEAIVLLCRTPSPKAGGRILAQIERSSKPAVVCFLGADQRPLWRAGAIPAGRLDEAAYRASAWVHGWDQALVSARLEDQDEQFSTLARDLSTWICRERQQLRGLFSSEILAHEAQLMLEDVLGKATHSAQAGRAARRPPRNWAQVIPEPAHRLEPLQDALADPEAGVVLLEVTPDREEMADPAELLAGILDEGDDSPLIIAHVCEPDPARRTAQEARLLDAGVILIPANAAAARLAGLVMIRIGSGWGPVEFEDAHSSA
jgi:FdrA protein